MTELRRGSPILPQPAVPWRKHFVGSPFRRANRSINPPQLTIPLGFDGLPPGFIIPAQNGYSLLTSLRALLCRTLLLTFYRLDRGRVLAIQALKTCSMHPFVLRHYSHRPFVALHPALNPQVATGCQTRLQLLVCRLAHIPVFLVNSPNLLLKMLLPFRFAQIMQPP